MIKLSDGDGNEESMEADLFNDGAEVERATLLYGTTGGTTAFQAKSRPTDTQQDQLLDDVIN